MVTKPQINNACKSDNEREIKAKMKESSKMKDKTEEEFGRKSYMDNKTIVESRMMFKIRSKMTDCKMNYPSDPRNKRDLWMCDSCQSEIDTQSHVLHCPAYAKLRQDRDLNNDSDICKYFVEVMRIRSKLGLTK